MRFTLPSEAPTILCDGELPDYDYAIKPGPDGDSGTCSKASVTEMFACLEKNRRKGKYVIFHSTKSNKQRHGRSAWDLRRNCRVLTLEGDEEEARPLMPKASSKL